MTQSGGNGRDHEVDPDSLNVFEPAFMAGEEDELVGWYNTDLKGEEGDFLSDNPLDDKEPPALN
jgi:hypothetical protein